MTGPSNPPEQGTRNVETFASSRVCDHCGKGFQARRAGKPQRFCSPSCRGKYHQERPLHEAHRCPRCGLEHEP